MSASDTHFPKIPKLQIGFFFTIEERIYPFAFMYIVRLTMKDRFLQYKKLKGKFKNHNFLLLVLTSVYYHSYYSSVWTTTKIWLIIMLEILIMKQRAGIGYDVCICGTVAQSLWAFCLGWGEFIFIAFP